MKEYSLEKFMSYINGYVKPIVESEGKKISSIIYLEEKGVGIFKIEGEYFGPGTYYCNRDVEGAPYLDWKTPAELGINNIILM